MKTISCLLAVSLTLTAVACSGCARQAKHQLKIDGLPADVSTITSYSVNITNASGTVEVLPKANLKAPWVDMKRSRPRAGAPDGGMGGPGRNPEQYSNATFSESDGVGIVTVVSTAGDVASSGEWVRIVVWVPSLTDVKIRNSGGRVIVKNPHGSVDIQNATTSLGAGSITCTSSFPMTSALSLSTNEGDIDVSMMPASDLKLAAVAGGGKVNVFARNTTITNVQERGSEWTGTINAGSAAGTIRTGKGDINVRLGGQN